MTSVCRSIGLDVLWSDADCRVCHKPMRRGDIVFSYSAWDESFDRLRCETCIRPAIEQLRQLAMLPNEERDSARSVLVKRMNAARQAFSRSLMHGPPPQDTPGYTLITSEPRR